MSQDDTEVSEQTPKQVIEDLARNVGSTARNIIVLAPQNDPFLCGTPTQIKQAEWFAALFEKFDFPSGVHLRRIHYRLQSMNPPVPMPDGSAYENSEECWGMLEKSSKFARYLGLVSAEAFKDKRNPEPECYAAEPNEDTEVEWSAEGFDSWTLPYVDERLRFSMDIPSAVVSGYEYDDGDQPYRLEVWAEKSTQNDVLTPLCRKYKANLCCSLGFSSITAVVKLLDRIREVITAGRPTRILYIADHDPAGECMPVSVARQIQFWLWRYNIRDADIKLNPLVLTPQQVLEYDLPRKPFQKQKDKRIHGFEERHGEGGVELDALEAMHPGEFERIVESALSQYRDATLQQRMEEAGYEAGYRLNNGWWEALSDVNNRTYELQHQIRDATEPFVKKLRKLHKELNAALDPFRDKFEELEEEARDAVEDAEASVLVEMPGRPVAEIDPPDESDWLFDASRPYMDQLSFFRDYKGADDYE